MFKDLHIFRVQPKDDLLQAITQYCVDTGITSAVILGIIGSLEEVKLNYLMELPGKYESVDYSGPLEIVAAQGSVAISESGLIIHLHIQVSTRDYSRGGHLASGKVFSTAEVIIAEIEKQIQRKHDDYTGLNELVDY